MAMNLRLDDDDTALLRALAEADGVSMNEAARRAIRRMARERGHQVHVGRASAEMLQRWGDVLDRLGKA
jgi:predicted transcriptional regulator